MVRKAVSALCGVIVVAAWTPSAHASFGFGPPLLFAGGYSLSPTTSDFNADGRPDVAIGSVDGADRRPRHVDRGR
jgi:hypothetical protein